MADKHTPPIIEGLPVVSKRSGLMRTVAELCPSGSVRLDCGRGTLPLYCGRDHFWDEYEILPMAEGGAKE